MNFLMKNVYYSIANGSKFQVRKEELTTFVCGTVILNLPQIHQISQNEGKSLTYENYVSDTYTSQKLTIFTPNVTFTQICSITYLVL